VQYLNVYASAPIESSVGAIFVFVITCDAECSLFPRAGLDASASAQAS